MPSLLLLGETLLGNGDAFDAANVLSDALLQGADPQLAVPLLIDAYIRSGQFSSLLAQIRPASVPTSLHAEVEASRAQAFTALGQLNEASQAIRRAQRLDPDNLRALLSLTTLQIRRGELEQARESAQTLLREHPSDSRSWSSYASTLHAAGELESALEAYQKALELSERNTDARIALLSILIDLDRLDQTQIHTDHLKTESPLDPRANYFRALAAARLDDRDAELEALNSAMSVLDQMEKTQLGSNPQLLMIGALTSYGLGAFESARDYLDTYLATNRNDFGAQRLRATVLLAQGEDTLAVQALLKLRDLAPTDPEVASLLATAYSNEGDYLRAARTKTQGQSHAIPRRPGSESPLARDGHASQTR